MQRTSLATLALLSATIVFAPSLCAQAGDAPVRYETDFPSAAFHQSRREAVMAALPKDALAVFFGAPERTRSNDMKFEYRQSSDFLYLTGSEEPGSALLLAPGGVEVDGHTVREVLFVPPRNPAQEVWLGRRFGPDRAMKQLGVELAVDGSRFDELFPALLERGDHELFHLPLPDGVERASPLAGQIETFLKHAEPLEIDQDGVVGFVLRMIPGATTPERFDRVRAIVGRARFTPDAVEAPELRELAMAFTEAPSFDAWEATRRELLGGRPDGTTLRTVLDELRTIKTDEEMAALRKAIDITAEAHREVMSQVRPGWTEYQIEALVEYTFKRLGAEYPGFPSIVGSGENSVILHYETNRRTTEDGDVIVIDIGAEYHGYTADVTRTIPVNGTYSPEERAIYALVYRAQQSGIEATLAGSALGAPHEAAARVLAEGMAELGLIESASDERGLRRFFMHGTSHYLGLDVHDVGTGGSLEPGTVITVEPGLYIPESEDIDPRWWNIGVRIEDDVLVTDGEPIILSAGAPRSPDDVEMLMRSRPIS